MLTRHFLTACSFMLALAPALPAQFLIYNNGSLVAGTGQYGIVTNPGQGAGGANVSAVFSPDTILGSSANSAGPFRLADDFVVPAGQIWTITNVHLFSYTTNGNVSTTVTAAVLTHFEAHAQPANSGGG
jgi:hypothetical protein